MMFCYGLTMRIGIFFADLTHPILVMVAVTFGFSACVFIASYMQSMWVFLIFYDILFGLLIGMTFMIPVV